MKMYDSPSSSCSRSSRLMTCAWIDTSSADTGSSQTMHLRPQRQGARDADPLPLPAGELVRVAVDVLGLEPDEVQQLLHRPRAVAARHHLGMDVERLADDVADGHPRVQRRVRVLHDHLHPPPEPPQLAAADLEDVPAVQIGPSRGRRLLAHEQPGERGLAAAGLADQPERLAAAQVEAHPVDRLHRPTARRANSDAAGEREVLDQRSPTRSSGSVGDHRAPPGRSGTRWSGRRGRAASTAAPASLQTRWAYGQRGWNAHPTGAAAGSAACP